MTDKEKLHQILSSLWKNDDSVGKIYYNQALQDAQTAIDLQEEPKKSIWHDAKEPPEIHRKYLTRYADGKVNGSWERHDEGFIPWKEVVKEHKFTHWCYIDDLLKLSNVERTGKDWKEEPVSEDLDFIATRNALAYVNNINRGESPWLDSDMELAYEDGMKAGAQWQKQKDKSKVLTEEQCRKIRDDAFELGKDAMKQQLMAKAITAHCFGFQGAALFSFRLPSDKYLVGSEVKVIVIKED